MLKNMLMKKLEKLNHKELFDNMIKNMDNDALIYIKEQIQKEMDKRGVKV